jgi:hypothetical protein
VQDPKFSKKEEEEEKEGVGRWRKKKKKCKIHWAQWLTSVIPTQETEIGRTTI